jgi:aminoglycoside 6'-N-acetyltransferase
LAEPERDGAVVVADGELRIRLMRDVDAEYALLAEWRNRPHVRAWWDPDDPPLSLEAARREYRAAVLGTEPERSAFIEVAGVPVGFVQFYPWAPFADELRQMELSVPEGSWSLDVLIGEPGMLDRGVGSRAVRLLCDHLLAHEGATAVAFGVDVDNARARRAYAKAGMTPTVEYTDLDVRDGRRIRAVLMLRTAAP